MDKDLARQILDGFSEIRHHLNIVALTALRPFNIGTKQAIILRLLADTPNCSLADLSRGTLSDPAAVTRAIDGLEKAKWVERNEHPNDRRRWVLSLTALGKKQIADLDRVSENISQNLVQDLSKSERNLLLELLNKVKLTLASETAGDTLPESEEI